MREKKYHIVLDDFERRVIVRCLNEIRCQLISTSKPVDDVNEILLQIIDIVMLLGSTVDYLKGDERFSFPNGYGYMLIFIINAKFLQKLISPW